MGWFMRSGSVGKQGLFDCSEEDAVVTAMEMNVARGCGWWLSVWMSLLLCSGLASASSDEQRLRSLINAQAGQVTGTAFEQIWRQVQALSTTELIMLSQAAGNNYFEQGWFELARNYRLGGSDGRPERLAQWQKEWFHHPAVAWLDRLTDRLAGLQPVPDNVKRMGVLLPLSGPFETQGREVLKGIQTALSWDRQRGFAVPELEVFDSNVVADPNDFIARRGQEYGLDLMLGPLKSKLTTKLDRTLSTPVLALNRVGGGRFNGYQLDLASDQELHQLVQLMQQEGRKRVLVLAPARESWVVSLMLSLRQQLNLASIQTLGVIRYGQDISTLELQLGKWLGIRSSQQRANALTALLGEEASFLPRRRQDIDSVLLIARPQQARLIKPMLDYHQASNVSVYASAHVYSGSPNPRLDTDLNGIVFCDMPWRLRRREGPESSSVFFALGMDAGSVYRALPRMGAGVAGYFEGETGNLRLPSGHRLERALLCARFKQGEPRPFVWGDGRSLQ